MKHAPSIEFSVARLESPLGDLLGAVDAEGVVHRLDFVDGRGRPSSMSELGSSLAEEGFTTRREDAAFEPLLERLDAYFAGVPDAFDGLHVAPRGTSFQCAVWDALRRIVPGTTRSYSELAQAVGRPKAVRAVGAANGANRIALLIPCHRVIGADGSLTGYAGGLNRKRSLLELEGALLDGRPHASKGVVRARRFQASA